MDEYTIYCTEEQLRKALELGAPIGNRVSLISGKHYIYEKITAEQMIGWLEEQGLRFEVEYCTMYCIMVHSNDTYICSPICANSRKEATLAAIDTALEYLVENDLIK